MNFMPKWFLEELKEAYKKKDIKKIKHYSQLWTTNRYLVLCSF